MGNMRLILLYTMAAFYVGAGIYHFLSPAFYMKIMPPWLPWHLELVYISGALEILLGLLLLPLATRRVAAWSIIVLLVVIFPANIEMMIDYNSRNDPYLWVAVMRLPLQLVLIWWAWQYRKNLKP